VEYSIITNNPTVAGKYENVIFVEGTVGDVLVKTRNLVQTGNSLITHPLPASIRMMYTPYRSIILGKATEGEDRFLQLQIAEESITKYKRIIEYRNVDYRNKIDYEKLDEILLINALHEIKIMEVAL